jgi:hypothetical protein
MIYRKDNIMKHSKLVLLSLAITATGSSGMFGQEPERVELDQDLPRYSIAYTKTKEGLKRILIDRQENKFYRLDLDRDDRIVSSVLVDKATQTVSATIKGKRVTVNLVQEEINSTLAKEKGDRMRQNHEALEDHNSSENRDIISRLLSKKGDKTPDRGPGKD